MKYFTLDWYHKCHNYADDAPTPDRTVWPRYRQHLEAMQGIVPADVLTLARLPGVDDALVVKVRHDRTRRVLAMTLRAGDSQIGYYDLVLRYKGANISPADEETLAQITRTTKTDEWHQSDVVFHELDQDETGHIVHRWLFHPGVWFEVRCESLDWFRLPKRNRRLPRLSNRFPDGPVTGRKETEH